MNLQTRKGGIQNEQIQKLYEQPFSFLWRILWACISCIIWLKGLFVKTEYWKSRPLHKCEMVLFLYALQKFFEGILSFRCSFVNTCAFQHFCKHKSYFFLHNCMKILFCNFIVWQPFFCPIRMRFGQIAFPQILILQNSTFQLRLILKCYP